ncbi:MAG TPA: amidase [Solirubrobacteraceae bacterium]|nr:amidase [Solirubrobacteraceae bacterium]
MTAIPLTLTEAASRLRAGELTSAALLEAALARADAQDERLAVYLARFDETAREAARRADEELAAGIDRGPLHGIPVGVKDVLAAREGPTTAQSLVLDPAWGRGRDATVVARLREAGAVLTGKTTTMEFAAGLPDPSKPFPLPRNPWDPERWPGGSSSGSAAGVAAGVFLAAIGTDTGGSIRLPAAYCGVCGLMPTYGRVPRSGCLPGAYTLDRIGPIAPSARDCGALLGAIAGPDPTDPSAADEPVGDLRCADADGSLAGVRVGVERAHHLSDGDDPALAGAFDAAVAELEAAGAEVTEVVLPRFEQALAAMAVVSSSETLAYHHADLRRRWEHYFAGTRQLAAIGALFSGADYVQAQRVRRVVQRDVARLLEAVDLVVGPTAATGAPTYEEIAPYPTVVDLPGWNTPYWSFVGLPALAVPIGFTADGLPLSMQLVARPFEEALLVRAGDAYQRRTDWHLRRPGVAA